MIAEARHALVYNRAALLVLSSTTVWTLKMEYAWDPKFASLKPYDCTGALRLSAKCSVRHSICLVTIGLRC